jgi:hypothetical protein
MATMSEAGNLLPAVKGALAAAKVAATDDGARALAEHYAALIDDARPERSLAKAVRVLDVVVDSAAFDTENPQREREIREAWDRVSSALAEHSVASDLGPKLLAALTSLGATLSGRKGEGAGGRVVPIGVSPLQAARDAARDRRHGASG